MLRFIYIGDQIMDDEKAFAFFDTVTDTFISFSGISVFDDWDDFLDWRKGNEDEYPQHDLERFWRLTPPHIRRPLTQHAPDRLWRGLRQRLANFFLGLGYRLAYNGGG